MLRLALLLLIAALVSACSQTQQAGPAMKVRGYAFSPPAFKSFCGREPGLCNTATGSPVVELTPERATELREVNQSVNGRIRQVEDQTSHGVADYWSVPSDVGDCEDLAILKKRELLKRGWPASALLLTVSRWGATGHTVLTVRTSQGDKILDSRTSSIRDWRKTPYNYFARQSQQTPGKWEHIIAPGA